MARKAILEGGKKDEIIAAATKLFFTEGYENTSVRSVLRLVDGEVGMFYHYFASKEELFGVVVDRFFRRYTSDFEAMVAKIRSPEEFVDVFLPSYEEAMDKYRHIESGMHWTIRSALHERTILSIIPAVEKLLTRFGYHGEYPLDIAAAVMVADISAAIHSASFQEMETEEKKQLMLRLINGTFNACKTNRFDG